MAEVISRRSIVFDILFDVEQGKKSAKEAETEINKLDKSASKLSDTFKGVGAAIGAAFTIQQLAQFSKEAFELGLKAEGVSKAFKELNDAKLLDDLRKATRGTVDDLTLMQSAVRADKFRIPLNELSRLLQFAQKRARETGQSVEFLANSIVDGIGRKSPLILDNLGLGAVELSEEFKRTGDFAKATGNIIAREMGKGGNQVDLTSDKVDRLRTAFKNFQQGVGTILVNIAGQIADAFTVEGDSPIQQTIKGLEKTRQGLELNLRALQDSNLSQAARNKLIDETNKLYGPYLKNIDLEKANTEDLVKVQEQLNKQFRAKIAQVAFEKQLSDILEQQATAAQGQLNVEIQRAKLEANRLTLTEEEIKFQEDLLRTAEEFNQQTLTSADSKIADLNESFKKLLATLNLTLDEVTNFGQETETVATRVGDRLTRVVEETGVKLGEIRRRQIEDTKQRLGGFFELPPEVLDPDEFDILVGKLKEQQQQLSANSQAAGVYAGAISESFSALSQLAKDGSAQQVALSIVSVLASQAQALASAIAGATAAAAATGPGAVIATPAFIATLTGLVLSSFGSIFGIIKQAQTAQAQLAEGEIDIHRKGERRGKDSINALLMPGESVMTTDETKRYKPILKAIRTGNLEDLIKVNYIDPALAAAGIEHVLKDSRKIPDYSERLYRELLEQKENNRWNKKIYSVLKDKRRDNWKH